MADRIAVFIDYMNTYKRCREAFRAGSRSHVDGQVLPLRLGIKLRDRAAGERELVSVRVYRGLPSSHHDPDGYGAANRQDAAWQKQTLVTPIWRPLNYRDPAKPREKGVDVRLAVDMVMMAMRKEFDVAVLVSEDRDLEPALTAVMDLYGHAAIETVTWVPNNGDRARPVKVSGYGHLVHRLNEIDYRHIHDPEDYVKRRRRR